MAKAVRIEGLKEFQAALKAAPDLANKVFDRALENGATQVRNKARREIRAKGTSRRTSGALQQRIHIAKKPLAREIISNLPYSRVIETGKRGGRQPPSGPLEAWAEKKLGIKGLGYVIARKIKQRGGIKNPNPFMETGAKKAAPKVNSLLDQAHKQLVNFLAGKGVRI